VHKRAGRYSLPEIPEIEMTEDNKKLQTVIDYFNQKVENAPRTYLIRNGSACKESYTLGKLYMGPRGLAIDLDISYERALKEGMPGDVVRATFPLARPGFLQDALAIKNLVAQLSAQIDKNNLDIFRYDFVGDRVVRVELYDLQDLKQVPEKYLKRARAIEQGEDARKAVDLAFDLWEWDNDM
jgi:hypothetical protein